jgi:phosphoglycolate phosphatase-like HAD superfamily hydrolase
MTIQGVLLDIDGTLINSNESHTQAWIQALHENDYRVSYNQIRPYIGMGSDNLLWSAMQLDSETLEGRVVSRRHGEIFREKYLPHIMPFRGARELLMRMHTQGLKLIAATSAEKAEAETLLKIIRGQDFIEIITSGSDVQNSKPQPDILKAALRIAHLEPADAVMIGDSPYDIEAAIAAGIPAIGFRCGGWEDIDLIGAAEIYDGPADLLQKYEKSLLARSEAAV